MPQNRHFSSIVISAAPSESSEGTNSSSEHDKHLHDNEWSHSSASQKTCSNPTNSIINSDVETDTLSIDTTSHSQLTDYERGQVESFFGGLGTEIYVSTSLANLYESTGPEGDWRLVFTGIPVVLHDKGSARARAMPRVTYVLAERGSSFALWSDRIDNLSNYRIAGPSFHTMCLSSNHQQLIGFSFDSPDSACKLWDYIEKLVSDPENIALSVPGRKQKQKRIKNTPLPPKSQISHPCQFQHVTSVTKEDSDRYYSMQVFAPLKHR